MFFLKKRYDEIHAECIARGFNVKYIFPDNADKNPDFYKDYIPTEAALLENRERIKIRMPEKARFTQHKTL